ncbi:hypothetical protein CEXT_434971 [Caerostris extrusa]|uniref:Uncharacterized protein n=1 Tax=Caerostris extrusa TaxID=172846 RepID=A0AAV4N267_CAEEX|nr:hypothetical protein CEXT_434971 [Caerostris extrusa]
MIQNSYGNPRRKKCSRCCCLFFVFNKAAACCGCELRLREREINMFGAEFLFGSVVINFLIGLTTLLLLYWYSIRNHDYWKRKVAYVKPFPFVGSILDILRKKCYGIESTPRPAKFINDFLSQKTNKGQKNCVHSPRRNFVIIRML